MKVLGICASPRKDGNTEILLEKLFAGARMSGAETEKLNLRDLNIAPCCEGEYDNVDDEGFSLVHDDMQLIFKKIQETDILIAATPIFFGSISAQMKTMVDRFQCVWLARNILHKELFDKKKKGVFISVEATQRQDFFDNARAVIKNFFATINVSYEKELFCGGVDKKGAILDKTEILQEAYEVGRMISTSLVVGR
ncbi:MAG: flavodoxin family protein [Candidatus Omnitrophota bacterium]